MKLNKYISTLALLASIPFFVKALMLFRMINGTNRDGDGIGLYFLGLEINDRVPYGQIPLYLAAFLVMGLLLIALSTLIYSKSKKWYAKLHF